ncbi:MAG: SCO family protein [Pseudomonadota bacterium]
MNRAVALTSFLAISGLAFASINAVGGIEVQSAPVVDIGGPFELIDHNNIARRDSDFQGRHMLVYFGYNWCPDICPTTLYNMSSALDLLGERDANRVQPIYISLDPRRDSPDDLKDYIQSFHPSFVALTGSEQEVSAVAKAYGVDYEKVWDSSGDFYYVDHTALIFLLDSKGNFVRFFSHEAQGKEIAQGLRETF